MAKLKTVLKSVLVFSNGELIQQLRFKTKAEAIGNYKLWNKYGKIHPEKFELIENATFELL